MELTLLILGILLLSAGLLDFSWTALWVDGGAGPLTGRLANGLWKALRKISKDRPRILSLAGPLILSVTLLSWILLLWFGWSLIFLSDPSSLASSQDNSFASWSDKFYYAGYLVFTLGNGDFKPTTGFWQTTTVLATGSGMLFITLAVTYLLSVLNAVTLKRSFAESIAGIGSTGSEVVKNAWNGKDFHNIDLILNTCATQISTLTAQHKAYPILHYYQASNTKEAMSVSLTIYDDALTLLQHGIPDRYKPNTLLIKESYSSIDSFLNTIDTVDLHSSNHAPLPLNLDELRKAGLPTVADQEFHLALSRLKSRRQKLLSIIETNARQWPSAEN